MNKRKFYNVCKTNRSESNLTELNAADAVDKGFMSHSDWIGHIMRYGFAMKTIEKMKPSRILDVGCGSMNLPKFLWRNRSSFHGKYVGIDLRAQEQWLEGVGTWKANVELWRMDIVLDLPTMWPSFDVVTCFEMFEHIPKKLQPELMKRLFNWTVKGGICLFSTPNAGVAKSTADNHVGEDGIRERTYKDKIKMAEAAGFVIERTFGTFCGSTRLPKEFLEQPHIQVMKEFLLDSFFVSLLATGFPEQSNNALFVMRHSK
jgi:2-polyprenyl-3-methyl-5-hydroxy-6-metoxy-1,4-benzoquinol methylase